LAGLSYEVELLGLVVNRAPVARRAAMARYALNRHGAQTPIGIGEDIGAAREAELAASPFEADPDAPMTGYELCEQVLSGREPGSVRGLFTTAFREAAWLIDQPHLWQAFARVGIMGGAIRTDDGWVPDTAFNNRIDEQSAAHFYRRLQEGGTPVTLVDRRLALWAKVPTHVWLEAAASSDPWVAEIGTAMRRQWERMWDGVTSGKLPPDRSPEWYLDNWCDGARPDWYRASRATDGPALADITPHVTGAPAYDVLATAALLGEELGVTVETHPAYPSFHVLRPDYQAGPERAVQAQLRLIRSAFGDSAS
jgi:hypothetical protein